MKVLAEWREDIILGPVRKNVGRARGKEAPGAGSPRAAILLVAWPQLPHVREGAALRPILHFQIKRPLAELFRKNESFANVLSYSYE